MSRTARVMLALGLLLASALQGGIYFAVHGYVKAVVGSAPTGYGSDTAPYRAASAWLVVALVLFILLLLAAVCLLLMAWNESPGDELATLSQLLSG